MHGSCFPNVREVRAFVSHRPHTFENSGATLGTPIFRHAVAAVTLLCPLLIVNACGSATETITRPSQPKCQVQAASEHVTFNPDGGTGTIRIETTRECTWSARSDVPWVSLASPATGQGEGSVQFTVAANANPVPRASDLVVEDQRLQVSQEGRRCEFRLSSTSESVDATGGERTDPGHDREPAVPLDVDGGCPMDCDRADRRTQRYRRDHLQRGATDGP